jgi:hypothetical protein
MKQDLYSFFEKTKQLHIWLSLTLFLTIIVIVIPFNIKPVGHLIVAILLSYILYENYIETHKIAQLKKKMLDDEDMKNNIIASYVLCGFMLMLILYLAYSCY